MPCDCLEKKHIVERVACLLDAVKCIAKPRLTINRMKIL